MIFLRRPWLSGAVSFTFGMVLFMTITRPFGYSQSLTAPPYQWPRSHNYDVQHYRIALSFDWSKKLVIGETTVRLRPFDSGFKEVELDAGDMNINDVKLDSGGPLKFRY